MIGFNSCNSVLIEVKVSRPDFLRDKKKIFRRNPHMGMGQFRYYCCPIGLIKTDELPDGWGLLYENEKGKIEVIKQPQPQSEFDFKSERTVLLSMLRRAIKDDKKS